MLINSLPWASSIGLAGRASARRLLFLHGKASAYFPHRTLDMARESCQRAHPTVPLLDAQGRCCSTKRGQQRLIPATASADQHQPVEQLTWAPGLANAD